MSLRAVNACVSRGAIYAQMELRQDGLRVIRRQREQALHFASGSSCGGRHKNQSNFPLGGRRTDGQADADGRGQRELASAKVPSANGSG